MFCRCRAHIKNGVTENSIKLIKMNGHHSTVLLLLGILSFLGNLDYAASQYGWTNYKELGDYGPIDDSAVTGGIENYLGANKTVPLVVGRSLDTKSGVYFPCKITYDPYDSKRTICRFSKDKKEEADYSDFEYLKVADGEPDLLEWVQKDALTGDEEVIIMPAGDKEDKTQYGVGRAKVDLPYHTISKVDMERELFITNYMGYKELKDYEVLVVNRHCI